MRVILLFSAIAVFVSAVPLRNLDTNARPCDVPSQATLPFCNMSLSLEERVDDLVARLQLSEKLTQWSNDGVAIPRLSISAIQWWGEALHGVGYSPSVNYDGEIKCVTSFPQVIGTGAAFNRSLWHAVGTTISTEARAMANAHQAGLTFWSPVINLNRDPRWGRLQESPGEDPFHVASYATEFARGLQEGEDSAHIKVSSCCKHFVAYSLEQWSGMDRHHFNAITTARDMSDSYLPPFEGCVREGRASSVMCSYNEVNGVPACANRELLTAIVREAWGFQGYITSDCDALDDIQIGHAYTNNTADTDKDTLLAGMDVACGAYMERSIQAAVQSGVIEESLLDPALKNQFAVRFRLGEFDSVASQPYMQYGPERVATKENQELALDAARQSIVLLKNDNNALPLSSSSAPTIGLIGPHVNATGAMQGTYYGKACFLTTPFAGLSAYTSKISSASGCTDVPCQKTDDFANAVHVAEESDVIVMMMGLDWNQEEETRDRYNLTLPGYQSELINTVAQAAGKKNVIVVLMSGGPIDVSAFKDNVAAIIWAGYPSQDGGKAIAQVIFGDYNPGGRTPLTWYPQSFVEQVSLFDMGMRPNASNGNPGRTYRFYTGTPVFPFGFGLSYTTFEYSVAGTNSVMQQSELNAVAVSAPKNNLRGHATDTLATKITVNVRNTGKVAGSDVVLVYVKPPHPPGVDGNPIKTLVGFERVFVEPGASVVVEFDILSSDFTLLDENAIRATIVGDWTILIGEEEFVVHVM